MHGLRWPGPDKQVPGPQQIITLANNDTKHSSIIINERYRKISPTYNIATTPMGKSWPPTDEEHEEASVASKARDFLDMAGVAHYEEGRQYEMAGVARLKLNGSRWLVLPRSRKMMYLKL